MCSDSTLSIKTEFERVLFVIVVERRSSKKKEIAWRN
jgi:hypothetical protein